MQKVQKLVLAILCLGGVIFPLRYCVYSAGLKFLSPILYVGEWFGVCLFDISISYV